MITNSSIVAKLLEKLLKFTTMTVYSQIDSNKRKTWLLMAIFTAFILVVGYIFILALGYQGVGALTLMGIFLIISGLVNLGSFYWSDKLVIAISGAKPIFKKDAPQVFRIVENLSIAQGTPMPKVYLISDPAPNAFATGRDEKHAAVAVTTGLLQKLDDLELEGVIAHELSHVKNYDTRLMAVVTVLVGMVAVLADFFLRSLWWGRASADSENRQGTGILMALGLIFAILAPIVAQLIRLAVSRRREFLADSSGALLTRYPEGLAAALGKISDYKLPARSASTATAHLYIANPFGSADFKNWFLNLFNTHPPIAERIKRLREMAV